MWILAADLGFLELYVRQKHQEKVLVIAEDYATLYKVNEKWPGHAVLIPPALDSQTARLPRNKVSSFFISSSTKA
ncbi:hypothetical protein DY000_02037271 [Brassica cretica]|uniref:HIT domain-containing protein n=1 Tax=Brassica cretica TaxID=69181 RepID=A0ABQ7BMU2_BRACR|nr:hypothetical protein DY000_02037271 [Brassica cretica]